MTTYIWSIDDAGSGDHLVEAMRRTCAHFDSYGVKATWFTVPKPNGKHLSREWRSELARQIEAGQDIQLHGLTHQDCYEFGPPAWPGTSINPAMQPEYVAHRDQYLPR